MHYQVSRDGQLYGPYTFEDLQRYIASGNVLLTDLAKSEDMPDWIPVAQVLNIASQGSAAPAYAPPSPFPPTYPAPAGIPYPDPPNLHWALVMLASLFTCGVFTVVWNILLCLWIRRVQPSSKALMLYLTCYSIALVGMAVSFANNAHAFVAATRHQPPPPPHLPMALLAGFIGLLSWAVRVVARFTLANSIEFHYNVAEPMGLRLNPIMTFFFGNLYFTYHINRLLQIKESMRYRNAAIGLS